MRAAPATARLPEDWSKAYPSLRTSGSIHLVRNAGFIPTAGRDCQERGVAVEPFVVTTGADDRRRQVESRVKFLGHPVHPMLIVFPLGLLATSVVFDIGYVVTSNGDLATFSFWALLAGLIGGLAAALFGLIDWLAIPKSTRAKRVGTFHGVGNLVVVGLFALSFLLRLDSAQFLPDPLPMILSLAGAAIALVTAWLGGELVYRLRVAVDDDANLDAQSSLGRDGLVDVKG
jgi:uncharacterized membrane protein